MKQTDVIVIGAGASGCMAAIAAASNGAEVLMLERNDLIGRKLYATGNGRCNLTNLYLEEKCYHTGDGTALSPYFERFSPADLCRFFEERGVFLHDRNGYVYPRTDQAATVVSALGKELNRLGVTIRTGCTVAEIRKQNGKSSFHVFLEGSGSAIESHAVILAAGGSSGPQFGCLGDSYIIARSLGHCVNPPVPALTSLHTSDKIVKTASRARANAGITLYIDGTNASNSKGELQFTDDSVSGIPAFQISGPAARALKEGRQVSVRIDFLPEISDERWKTEMERRMSEDLKQTMDQFFLGLVNNRVLGMILRREGLQAENKAYKLPETKLLHLFSLLRDFELVIDGAGGFDKAQTTSGGVPLSELDDHLQSKKCSGLYITGEAADVDGLCGGYNLQWAMTSGYLAGKHAGRMGSSDR